LEVTAAMGKGPLNRGPNWTADEDRKLLDLIEAGKSWTSIAVLLKRSQASVKVRARTLKRRAREMQAEQVSTLSEQK
jgi:DNA-binding NarL/FixJ family response regulator